MHSEQASYVLSIHGGSYVSYSFMRDCQRGRNLFLAGFICAIEMANNELSSLILPRTSMYSPSFIAA